MARCGAAAGHRGGRSGPSAARRGLLGLGAYFGGMKEMRFELLAMALEKKRCRGAEALRARRRRMKYHLACCMAKISAENLNEKHIAHQRRPPFAAGCRRWLLAVSAHIIVSAARRES